MLEWISAHETAIWWISVGSGILLVGTLGVTPFVVARVPADYFLHEKPPTYFQTKNSILRLIIRSVKDFLGVVFILAGVLMLVLPGQGILTILIGITLSSFPGKRALQRRIIMQPSVLRSINWMRAKMGRPPLELPPSKTSEKQSIN